MQNIQAEYAKHEALLSISADPFFNLVHLIQNLSATTHFSGAGLPVPHIAKREKHCWISWTERAQAQQRVWHSEAWFIVFISFHFMSLPKGAQCSSLMSHTRSEEYHWSNRVVFLEHWLVPFSCAEAGRAPLEGWDWVDMRRPSDHRFCQLFIMYYYQTRMEQNGVFSALPDPYQALLRSSHKCLAHLLLR